MNHWIIKNLTNLTPGDLIKYKGGSKSKYLTINKKYKYLTFRQIGSSLSDIFKVRIVDDNGKYVFRDYKFFDIKFNMETKVKTPDYYNGDNEYTAKQVVDNFELNYHLGTAVTYILRAYKKHKTPNQDLQKAIDHLTFELEKLERKDQWRVDQYNRNRHPSDHIIAGTE